MLPAASLLLLAIPAAAQDTPQPAATPAPAATPTPAPLPTPFFLPPLQPQTQTQTPTPTPTPTVAPTPVATATPRATATLRPRTTPAPVASLTPPAAVTPAPTPTPTPTPTIVPVPMATPAPAPIPNDLPYGLSPVREEGGSPWPWLALAVLLGGGGAAAWIWWRRRGEADDEEAFASAEEPIAVATVPGELPQPSFLQPAAPAAAAARLDLSYRPTRAGLNMLSATVEGEVTVTNFGEGEATDVRVRVGLLTAAPDLDAMLAEARAEPIGKPAAPAFTLAPGETRVVRVVAAAPRDGLRVMTAGERPMFVPVVAIDLGFAGGPVLSQAFAVGVERVDSPKLAPIWLDVPPRSYEQVAARPHGAPVVQQAG